MDAEFTLLREKKAKNDVRYINHLISNIFSIFLYFSPILSRTNIDSTRKDIV